MEYYGKSRIFTQRDFWWLVRLPLFFVSAWILPERVRNRVGLSAAWIGSRLRFKTYSDRVQQFARTFGINAGDPHAKQAVIMDSFKSFDAIMQYCREYRWGGWHPQLFVSGHEHLVRARGQGKGKGKGKGAILWVQNMPYSNLVAKKALAGIGVPLHHLTRPSHGFSASRFAICVLNPLLTRIENRYLAERITIRDKFAIDGFRTLLSRLENNRVISITVGDEAVKTVEVSFFNAKMKLATGPIELSLQHGAPLIPVFTIRSGDNSFQVIIGPPLSSGPSANTADGIEFVANEYASRLEHFYREHEDQRTVLGCVFVT